MRITDLLKKDVILINAHVSSKECAINMLVDLMVSTGNIKDSNEFKKSILEREEQGTTGIGGGIAIPHAKTNAVKEVGIVAMSVEEGIDYNSLDGGLTKMFFMIAVPEYASDIHLDLLSSLSTLLMDKKLRKKLIDSKTEYEFLYYINEAEKAMDLIAENGIKCIYDVLAVTACPTGIAHTYMAAESLENTGREMGISVKVETNGSVGVRNELTDDEISYSKCIIIAADTSINMSRFEGKRVIQASTADGIHRAASLLECALKSDVPIYNGSSSKKNIGHHIYVHLMSGISSMLPFVIGGGILIAFAFLFDDYSINPQNFGSNLPFSALLKSIGDISFRFMLPVLAGFIAMSIGDRPALAMGFIGGFIAKEGGSGFIGAMAAGFVAGYVMLFLKKTFSKIPSSLEGIKTVLIYPVIGILIIGVITKIVVNPPLSALNLYIFNGLNSMGSTSRVFLGIILGGMMAVDMGGPVNKAAYVFGTASLESGQFEIMAAVMAGGMMPSLITALCTTFFGNRFTVKEKQEGLINYILGLSFISEGAIPFAAADPLRVIPSCVIGASTAGGLSMFFGCTLRAPHGGIFVIPLAGNPVGFIIAIVSGAVVGMLCLAALKRPLK